LANGVGDSLACDVGCGTVNGFEHRGEFSFRIQIRRRSNADGSHDGGAQVGENISKQIRSHNHVKPIRVADKVSGQDIDVILVVLISEYPPAIS